MLYNSYPPLAFDGSNLRARRARRVPTPTFFDTCNDDIFQVVVRFLSIGNLRKFALLCCQSRHMVWEILRSETIVANESHISDDDLRFLCRLPFEIKNLCHNGVTYRFKRDVQALKIQLGYACVPLYVPPYWDEDTFRNCSGSMTRRICVFPFSHIFCNTTIKANCTIQHGRVCLTMRVLDTSNVAILSSSCEKEFGLSSICTERFRIPFCKEIVGSSVLFELLELLQAETKLQQHKKMHRKYIIQESDYLKNRIQCCNPKRQNTSHTKPRIYGQSPRKKSYH